MIAIDDTTTIGDAFARAARAYGERAFLAPLPGDVTAYFAPLVTEHSVETGTELFPERVVWTFAHTELQYCTGGDTPMTARLVHGATRAELPGWMVKTAEENKLSHVLLMTRHRGTIDARTGEGFGIGRGMVEGIGFYIDTLYTMQSSTTGALSSGLLAPYTQIRLTLMDAVSGAIVNTYVVRESFAHAAREGKAGADPWSFMPTDEKVRVLRSMVAAGVSRGVQALLKP